MKPTIRRTIRLGYLDEDFNEELKVIIEIDDTYISVTTDKGTETHYIEEFDDKWEFLGYVHGTVKMYIDMYDLL